MLCILAGIHEEQNAAIIAIIFFLVLNTSYYWEGKLGIYFFPVILLLFITFASLLMVLADRLYQAVKGKFKDRQNIYLIILLAAILSASIYRPGDFFNLEERDGTDILVAENEGAANCFTKFKLKKGNRFIEKNYCFGITETTGKYTIINDTIWFDGLNKTKNKDDYYKLALVKPSVFSGGSTVFELLFLKDINDSIGKRLVIKKNYLSNLKE